MDQEWAALLCPLMKHGEWPKRGENPNSCSWAELSLAKAGESRGIVVDFGVKLVVAGE